MPLNSFKAHLVQCQRGKIRVRHVAVVLRLLFAAQAVGLACDLIQPARLLLQWDAGVLEVVGDVAPTLGLWLLATAYIPELTDCLLQEADRVDILDLAARAERLSWSSDRDVGVDTEISLPSAHAANSPSIYTPSPCRRRPSPHGAAAPAACARKHPPPLVTWSQHSSVQEAHLICGCVTISISPVPARLRSTSTSLPTVWLLAVSCH